MDMSKFKLQKQNTSYEISFNRAIVSPYMSAQNVRRYSRPSSKASREKMGSRCVAAARGGAEVISCEIIENGMKRSLSAGHLPSKSLDVFQSRQSHLPVLVKSNDSKSMDIRLVEAHIGFSLN